jgi:Tol biopolymer transport system component
VRGSQIGAIASLLMLASAGVVSAASPATPGASNGPAAGTPDRIVYAFGQPGTDLHVFTMAPDGTDVIQVTPFDSHWGVWSPDGTRLAVPQAQADGRMTTMIIGWDGSDPRTLPLPDDSAQSLAVAAWSADGTRIVYDGFSDTDPSLNGIFTSDPDGGDLVRITTAEGGGHDVLLSFSPDGRSLLVVRTPATGNLGDLYVMAADGSAMRRVTPEGQQVWLTDWDVPATWSPDGASIAFTAFEGPDARSATFVVGADGDEPVQVSDWGMYDTGARFSPDGQWVLYDMALAGEQHDLFLVHPDGSGRVRLTDLHTTGVGNCCGNWAPDSQHVVFQAGPDSAAQLWTVAIDGTDARQITTAAGEYGSYSWALAAPTDP